MTAESRNSHWAIIRESRVDLVVVWDGVSDWSAPDSVEVVNLANHPHVGVGWDYVDGEFVDNRPVEEFEV